MIDLEKEKRKRIMTEFWEFILALSSWAFGLFLCTVMIVGFSAFIYILIQSAPDLSTSECTCKE